MIRPFYSLVLLAVVAGTLPSDVWGQVGAPPRRAQPQPTPRNAPPGPSAEDVLRFLFPPQSQSDDFDNAPQPTYQRTIVAASQAPLLRVPSAAEVVQMSAHGQRALLRRALARLDEELDQLSTGASWKAFLQTSDLGHALWSRPESEPAPDADTRQRLKVVAARFTKVAQQPEYQVIGGLQGFQVAYAVLPEYATGEVERSQRNLRATSATLADALSRLNTGPGWKEHLQTDDLQRLAKQSEEPQPADSEILQLIAQKFDKVAANPQYRLVSSSAGFASSRDALERLIKAHQEEQAAQAQRGGGMTPARPDASHLERMVVALQNDLAHLQHHCAEESRAREALNTLQLAQAAPNAGDTVELARKAQSANDVLRDIIQQHEEKTRAIEEKLRGLLKGFQSGSTKRVAGQPVMLLPLDAPPPKDTAVVELMQFTDEPSKGRTVELMPLGVDQPKDKTADLLPLGVDPPKEKESSPPKPK